MEPTPPDPVDDLLRGDFSSATESPLRRGLLEKTIRQLRRGRLVRRCALAGSWAACFVAGAPAMFLWHASMAPDPGGNGHQPVAERPGPKEKPAPPKDMAKPDPAAAAVAKEWEAFDSTGNRAALFFEAGDRYFNDNNDITSALRCYRQALDASSPEQLAISPNDNWLLISLKQSRQ